MQTLGQKIKAIRLRKGMTQIEFGAILKTTDTAVRNWETSRNAPNPERLKRIAELGNITLEELLNGINPLSLFSDLELINELQRRAVLRDENVRPKD